MARIKEHARDLLLFVAFGLMLFNCSYQKPSCKGLAPDRTLAPTEDDEATAPAHDALVEMSCACASAPELGDECAEDLWETRDLSDEAGCSQELDALLFCVEDGDACGEDAGEWACDEDEAAWRDCIGARRGAESDRAARN